MRQKIFLAICFLLLANIVISAQVDFYFYHVPNNINVKPHEVGSGYLYNRTGVTIEVKFDVKVFNDKDKLVYHIISPTHSIISGKTIINRLFYKGSVPIVNELGRNPLLNHRVVVKVLHPQDLSSIIAMYDIFTKNYIKSNDPKDRYEHFYNVAKQIEITSREKDFCNEGTKLTFAIKRPPKAKKIKKSDISIDLAKSKLLSLKDNTGKEYLNERFHLLRERANYIVEIRRKGQFIYCGKELKHIDIPFMKDNSEIATFTTNVYSIPQMATNLTAEGYVTIVKHEEQLITDTIDVNLFDGKRTIIENTRIDWKVSGAGSCNKGTYDLIYANTALKIKSITVLNPMVEICSDNSNSRMSFDRNYLPVYKDKLPYKAKLIIIYHKPTITELYFKQEFNLSLNLFPVKISTDHNTDAGISKLIVRNSKDKPKISVEFPLSDSIPKPGFNAKKSYVEIKDNKGRLVDLGNVDFKDNYYNFNNKFIIEIEKLPPKGSGFLNAEINLALDEYVEGTKTFTFILNPNKEAKKEIDNYNMVLIARNNRDSLNYTLFPKGANYCCGIPGREITKISVFDENEIKIKGDYNAQSIIIPDGIKRYKIQITTKKKRTKFKKVIRKISLGSIIK